MKMLLILSVFFIATACNSSKDDNTEKSVDPGPNKANKVDTTPYSQCDRGTPASRIQGRWMQSFEQNGFQFIFALEFFNDSVRVTNHCTFHEHTLMASARSSTSLTRSSISILQTSRDEEHIDEGSFDMKCDVNIQPMELQYSFKGSCLVLKNEQSQETMTYVRAE